MFPTRSETTARRTRLALESLECRETPSVADIVVEKSDGLAEISDGSSTVFTIRVTNNGPDAVSNVAITDDFPTTPANSTNWTAEGLNGATVNQTSGTFDFTILADMPVGSQVVVRATFFAFPRTAGGLIVNTATATLAPGDTDPNPANNSATDVTLVGQSSIGDFGGSLYAVGPGAGHVKVYSTATGELVHSFLPFGAGYANGVEVATGDVTGDGQEDAGAGPGAPPHVKVFDGRTLQELASFYAFDPAFAGGVSVG